MLCLVFGGDSVSAADWPSGAARTATANRRRPAWRGWFALTRRPQVKWSEDVGATFGGTPPMHGFAEAVLVDGNRVICTVDGYLYGSNLYGK